MRPCAVLCFTVERTPASRAAGGSKRSRRAAARRARASRAPHQRHPPSLFSALLRELQLRSRLGRAGAGARAPDSRGFRLTSGAVGSRRHWRTSRQSEPKQQRLRRSGARQREHAAGALRAWRHRGPPGPRGEAIIAQICAGEPFCALLLCSVVCT